jgi:hypothetical protein
VPGKTGQNGRILLEMGLRSQEAEDHHETPLARLGTSQLQLYSFAWLVECNPRD